MQTGLIIIGTLAVVAALVFSGFAFNPVVYCLLAWSVLWLGIWQAKRLHITAGNEAQAKPAGSAMSFWSIRLSVLLLSLAVGFGTYTLYLVRIYELPINYPLSWFYGFNKELPNLVEIPSGSFEMGSQTGGPDEQPVHRVSILDGFLMGESEVTFEQYDYYVLQMRLAGYKDIVYPNDEGWGRTGRPVININWSDSQGYLNWLNQNNQQRLNCRLPSESEWEYAARARTPTPHYWGDKSASDYAKYWISESDDVTVPVNQLDPIIDFTVVVPSKAEVEGLMSTDSYSLIGSEELYISDTAFVKQLKPNGFGLYDMSGNVWEWVQDKWHDNYQGAPEDGSAWESGNGVNRVLRGGSWSSTPDLIRSASRHLGISASSSIGFRIVCHTINPN